MRYPMGATHTMHGKEWRYCTSKLHAHELVGRNFIDWLASSGFLENLQAKNIEHIYSSS